MTADRAPRMESIDRLRAEIGDGSFEWTNLVRTADLVALLAVADAATALLDSAARAGLIYTEDGETPCFEIPLDWDNEDPDPSWPWSALIAALGWTVPEP